MDSTISSVQTVLATTGDRWLQLTETVPTDLLDRAPAPGEWSATACLRHLLDTERFVFPVRVRAFLAGEDMAAFDPDAEGACYAGHTPRQLAAEFVRLREASLALLSTLAADDLARAARHSELGQVTLGELLHEWAAHDLNHTIQAERSLMQPFIAGCGPWRSYFADHDMTTRVESDLAE
jgi:hypothetical protein